MDKMAQLLVVGFLLSLQDCLGMNTSSQGIMDNATQEYEAVAWGLLHKTQRELRPDSGGNGKPTKVKVGMYLLYLGNFQEANMEFTVELYFRQYWQDPRLAFNGPLNRSITFVGEATEKFWHPHTYFENSRKGAIHEITGLNKNVRVSADGGVFSSMRLAVTCSCAMNFRNFPMDKQTCDLNFMSYGYVADEVVYEWADENVEWTGEHEIAQFDIDKVAYFKNVKTYAKGDYKGLGVRFHFTRRIGYYIIRVYTPAALVVLLSWLSFFVDRNSAPARVSLGITTVLTMTTLLIGIGQGSLPVVSYVKAVDLYLIVCYVLVFGAFAEFALMSHKDWCPGVRRKKRALRVDSEARPVSTWRWDDAWLHPKESLATIPEKGSTPRPMDEWSKILFLAIFMLFNMAYWCYFLIIAG